MPTATVRQLSECQTLTARLEYGDQRYDDLWHLFVTKRSKLPCKSTRARVLHMHVHTNGFTDSALQPDVLGSTTNHNQTLVTAETLRAQPSNGSTVLPHQKPIHYLPAAKPQSFAAEVWTVTLLPAEQLVKEDMFAHNPAALPASDCQAAAPSPVCLTWACCTRNNGHALLEPVAAVEPCVPI